MPKNPTHVIVIGASAGGVSALIELTAALPERLEVPIGIVLHVGSRTSILPELLNARSNLAALHPRDGQPLLPGSIFVAPPDHHMLFTATSVRLSRGPRENHARPAIDPLFRSTALAWKQGAIGVVLTGELDDGTAGLKAIKDCGGIAIVQDPLTATEPSMPASAIANVPVDYCLPVSQIPAALLEIVGRPPGAGAPTSPDHLQREQAIFEGDQPMENLALVGKASSLTCPDCGGSLWELNQSPPLRYRCHTGHAFTARTLESSQVVQTEQALWSSVRALQEREILLRRLATVADATGDEPQAQAGRRQADRVKAQAKLLSRMVEKDMNSA
jgi:two-component system, chemotaxis family, protein-glutamate methylesterase/glutaminase